MFCLLWKVRRETPHLCLDQSFDELADGYLEIQLRNVHIAVSWELLYEVLYMFKEYICVVCVSNFDISLFAFADRITKSRSNLICFFIKYFRIIDVNSSYGFSPARPIRKLFNYTIGGSYIY